MAVYFYNCNVALIMGTPILSRKTGGSFAIGRYDSEVPLRDSLVRETKEINYVFLFVSLNSVFLSLFIDCSTCRNRFKRKIKEFLFSFLRKKIICLLSCPFLTVAACVMFSVRLVGQRQLQRAKICNFF